MPHDIIVGMRSISRPRGSVPTLRQASRWERLWAPFWVLPAAMTAGAMLLALALVALERELRGVALWVFPGGPDAARGILTTIASVTISTMGVVVSVTMVVLQLASSAFTPRLLGSFLKMRVVQSTLGIFIGTFVFCLTVLRSIVSKSDDSEGFIPRVAVSLGLVLAMGCIGMLLAFLRSVTESIQVSNVISRVGDSTSRLMNVVLPGGEAGDDETFVTPAAPEALLEAGSRTALSDGDDVHRILVDDRHGYLNEMDLADLEELANARRGTLRLEKGLGDFCIPGQLLATFWGNDWEPDADDAVINASVRLSTERSLQQDLGFGFRQLLDIADRALSPGVNDPTTAVQVVNEIHRLLREAVSRHPASPYILDEQGTIRVISPGPDVERLVRVSISELHHYGADSPEVGWHLTEMIDDLLTVAIEPLQPTLRELRKTLPGDEPYSTDEQAPFSHALPESSEARKE